LLERELAFRYGWTGDRSYRTWKVTFDANVQKVWCPLESMNMLVVMQHCCNITTCTAFQQRYNMRYKTHCIATISLMKIKTRESFAGLLLLPCGPAPPHEDQDPFQQDVVLWAECHMSCRSPVPSWHGVKQSLAQQSHLQADRRQF
jgi:hypothetical protein